MLNNFHILGIITTVSGAGVLYLVLSAFISLDGATYAAAVLTALVVMEVSYVLRRWGSGEDKKKVLAGMGASLGGKVAVVVAAYLAVRTFTSLNAVDFLIFLVAIYFVLFIFEIVYLVKIEYAGEKE